MRQIASVRIGFKPHPHEQCALALIRRVRIHPQAQPIRHMEHVIYCRPNCLITAAIQLNQSFQLQTGHRPVRTPWPTVHQHTPLTPQLLNQLARDPYCVFHRGRSGGGLGPIVQERINLAICPRIYNSPFNSPGPLSIVRLRVPHRQHLVLIEHPVVRQRFAPGITGQIHSAIKPGCSQISNHPLILEQLGHTHLALVQIRWPHRDQRLHVLRPARDQSPGRAGHDLSLKRQRQLPGTLHPQRTRQHFDRNRVVVSLADKRLSHLQIDRRHPRAGVAGHHLGPPERQSIGSIGIFSKAVHHQWIAQRIDDRLARFAEQCQPFVGHHRLDCWRDLKPGLAIADHPHGHNLRTRAAGKSLRPGLACPAARDIPLFLYSPRDRIPITVNPERLKFAAIHLLQQALDHAGDDLVVQIPQPARTEIHARTIQRIGLDPGIQVFMLGRQQAPRQLFAHHG